MRTLQLLLAGLLTISGSVLLGGCAATPHPGLLTHRPELGVASKVERDLNALPLPAQPIEVAVYGFADQTGQFKPTDAGQSLSRAVSQGGTTILVKALEDAGQGNWFSIVEREHLDDVLKERQIIREMRAKYMGEDAVNAAVLPPMVYAGVIFEGGIVGFDSNTVTGGLGAKFLGIGANGTYKQDTVTVYLRAVSTKTSQVLASVVVRKSIASVGLQTNVFRFVDFMDLFEADAGVTTNEPAQFALQQAVEKAVLALILEGTERGLWGFAEPATGTPWLDRYDKEKGFARTALIARRDPAPAVLAAPTRALITAPSPLDATRSGDPELSPHPPAAPFDPATAATRGGSSGIATSAAGVAPPGGARPAASAAPPMPPSR